MQEMQSASVARNDQESVCWYGSTHQQVNWFLSAPEHPEAAGHLNSPANGKAAAERFIDLICLLIIPVNDLLRTRGRHRTLSWKEGEKSVADH